MINIDKPFILYANAEVTYDGRASSTLPHGNYLVIKKDDGSILIHGANKCTPKNYQGPGTKHTYSDNTIISKSKKESITIKISNIISYIELVDWSDDALNMSKTELQLQTSIVDHIEDYIPNPAHVVTSFYTPIGSIDIYVLDDTSNRHIIEVKRKKAGVSAIYQLQRYIDHFKGYAKGYIAAPELTKKAQELLEAKGFQHIKVNH